MTGDDSFDGSASFDASAELYDRARPSYPDALVNDLPSLAQGARVLEIGPGTGQLTLALAARGCHVTAVERGPRLAALLQQRLALHYHVRVVVARFEDWPLPAEPFDLVVCATAFHWLDPAVRVAKSLAALRRGGALAVIATHHVAGGTRQFFADAQPCYERWYPDAPRGFSLPEPDTLPRARDLPGASTVHRYVRDVAYDTASYLELLRTYSETQRLPPPEREGFLRELGALIETRYDGRVVKRYLFELALLHRA